MAYLSMGTYVLQIEVFKVMLGAFFKLAVRTATPRKMSIKKGMKCLVRISPTVGLKLE